MLTAEYYDDQWEHYAERVDTPQPCEVGDRAEVSQLSGVPSWAADYPLKGKISNVEPRGFGTHQSFAHWFVTVRIDDDQDAGVHGTVTETYQVGGSHRDWEDIPVQLNPSPSSDSN